MLHSELRSICWRCKLYLGRLLALFCLGGTSLWLFDGTSSRRSVLPICPFRLLAMCFLTIGWYAKFPAIPWHDSSVVSNMQVLGASDFADQKGRRPICQCLAGDGPVISTTHPFSVLLLRNGHLTLGSWFFLLLGVFGFEQARVH